MKDTSVWKIVLKVIAVLAVVAGIVYAVYHWELDKKFLALIKKCRCKCSCSGQTDELPVEAQGDEPAEPVPQDIPGVIPECTMDDVEIIEE